MVCVHFESFVGFTLRHSSSVTFFPLALAFFFILKSQSLSITVSVYRDIFSPGLPPFSKTVVILLI
jgi:hypothetical protein